MFNIEVYNVVVSMSCRHLGCHNLQLDMLARQTSGSIYSSPHFPKKMTKQQADALQNLPGKEALMRSEQISALSKKKSPGMNSNFQIIYYQLFRLQMWEILLHVLFAFLSRQEERSSVLKEFFFVGSSS